jgi:uncharacterized protein (AIM24 family)
MTSGTARRDPATDEEFLAQLYKGGELLASGKINEAKDYLERAYELHPKNEKAQNLLGLTYFKLGLFERASAIYELLVNDNPVDPTLRVNLGLVYLKSNDLVKSVKEFETATDLEPGHKKAHNYLGLALAQAGDYARAREHFVISGSDVMAEKMGRAMVSAAPPATVKMSTEEPPPPPAPSAPIVAAVAEEEQIEVMSDETAMPTDHEAPPPENAPSPMTLVAQAGTMGGAGGPPLPQPGFEELPAALNSDWGAQFGMEPKSEPTVVVDEEMRFAEDEGPSAATSEAAVATGMQVPASVMTEASSDEMPLVETAAVIEATIEEVNVESPVVMVEQNVLVPVDEQGALTEQPLPSEHEPMVSPQGQEWGEVPATLSGEDARWAAEQAKIEPNAQWTQAPAEQSEQWAEEPAAQQDWAEEPAGPVAAESDQWASQSTSQVAQQWTEGSAPEAAEGEQWAEESAGGAAPVEEAVTAPDEEQAWAETSPGAVEEGGTAAEGGQSWEEPAAPAAEALPTWVTGATPDQEAAVNSYASKQEAPPEVQPGFQAIAVPKLADLGPQLDYGQSNATGPFHVGPEGLAVTINGEMLSRLTGLVAVVGGIDAQPETRRNRGRAIDQAFGEGASQLQRVKGHGTLYLEPGKAHFQAIDLNDEGCYLREERVFAFEEAVAFENARLTAGTIGVDMVHLKGHGAVLLKLEGGLKAMAIPSGTPLRVPLARLVGWYGQVSPRVMMGFVGQASVELTGDGYALLAAPG